MKIDDSRPVTTATPRPAATGAGFGVLLGAMDTAAQSADGRAVGFQDRGMFGRMEPTASAPHRSPPRVEATATPQDLDQGVQADRQAARPFPRLTGVSPATPSRPAATALAYHATVQTDAVWAADGGTPDAIDLTPPRGTDPARQTGTENRRPRATPILVREHKHPNVMVVAPGTTDDSVSLTLFLAGLTAKEQTAFRRRAEALTRDYGVALDKLVFTSEGTSQTGATLKGPTSWR